MKVLMTTDTVGGVWRYTIDLAALLCERGARVTVAALGEAPSRAMCAEAERVVGLELATCPGRLEWMHEPWRDVDLAGQWLLRLAAAKGVDVVHLGSYAHAALPFVAPVVVVAHSCVLSWWEAVHDTPPPPEFERYKERVTQGLRAASAVVAPSRAMLSALARHYGPLTSAHVIFNARKLTVTERPKDPIVLAAGRLWDEAKNVLALDSAADDLVWPVLVAGDTSGAEGHVAPRKLAALGRLEAADLQAWMERAAVFAHPACYEPFGLAVLEAAMSGCALVLGDIPSLRELWDGAALFVPPRDTNSLSRALRLVTHDAALRSALAERAKDRARRYRPDAQRDAYLALYETLLAGGPTKAPQLTIAT